MGALENGSFVRESRGKGFFPLAWNNSEPSESWELRAQALDPGEAAFVPLTEARFEIDLGQLDSLLRLKVEDAFTRNENLSKLAQMPLNSVGPCEEGFEIEFASGVRVRTHEILFCDSWSKLRSVKGIKKNFTSHFISQSEEKGSKEFKFSDVGNKWGGFAVVQVFFEHVEPVISGSKEGFLFQLSRDAKEEPHTHAMGSFSIDGSFSSWTALIPNEKAEDNHEVSKKIHRVKQALSKAFGSLKPGFEFMKNVHNERVHFVENACFAKPPHEFQNSEVRSLETKVELADADGKFIHMITESLGPTLAFAQLDSWMRNLESPPQIAAAAASQEIQPTL